MMPLDGVRVVDLTQYTAGPFCTKILADYGADVIKIEPQQGDPARRLGPFYKDTPGLEHSGLFLFLNTNKRSVTLNLEAERGKQILRALVLGADILVENFAPDVMRSLGLGYEELAVLNPRLVMTSISNFGQTGPYMDWQATDLTLFAMGGTRSSAPEREPVKLPGNVASYHVGYMASLATSLALIGAEFRGEGEHIDVSGFEVLATSIERLGILMGYEFTKNKVTRTPGVSAFRLGSGVFPCADGYYMISSTGADGFPALARAVGARHLLEQPEWATPEGRARPEAVEEFDAILAPWIMERSKAEIHAIFERHSVLGAPVNSIDGVVQDQHFRARGYFQRIDHPVVGQQTYPGYNFIMHTGEPMPARRSAPLLGEHTAEILCSELGYSSEDLRVLRAHGVV